MDFKRIEEYHLKLNFKEMRTLKEIMNEILTKEEKYRLVILNPEQRELAKVIVNL